MKFAYIASVLAVIIIVVVLVLSNSGRPGVYDNFTRCISDAGFKFYGAYWCPHCNDQKDMFGKSAKGLPYIECSLPNNAGQTAECARAGITSYPTWELPSGKRVLGLLSIQELATLSNCPLNATG